MRLEGNAFRFELVILPSLILSRELCRLLFLRLRYPRRDGETTLRITVPIEFIVITSLFARNQPTRIKRVFVQLRSEFSSRKTILVRSSRFCPPLFHLQSFFDYCFYVYVIPDAMEKQFPVSPYLVFVLLRSEFSSRRIVHVYPYSVLRYTISRTFSTTFSTSTLSPLRWRNNSLHHRTD